MPEKCVEHCAEVVRLEHHLDELEAQNSSSHQLIYDRLRALETSDAVQEAHYTAIIDKLDALTAKVEAMEAKPAKRWEGLVEKALWAVCAAVIAFLLGRVGL